MHSTVILSCLPKPENLLKGVAFGVAIGMGIFGNALETRDHDRARLGQPVETGNGHEASDWTPAAQPSSREISAGVGLDDCEVPVIKNFSAMPESIGKGQKSRLEVEFTNGKGVITPGDMVVEPKDSVEVRPAKTTKYTLTVTGEGGKKVTAKVTVTVDSKSAQGALRAKRCYHTATLLPSGKVLIMGGRSYSNNQDILSSVELFDPESDCSVGLGSLKKAHAAHSATMLKDGCVLVTGGFIKSKDYGNTFELYDPSKGESIFQGEMTHERGFHTATLLKNGKVLLVGGSVQEPFPAEIYEPDSRKCVVIGKPKTIRIRHTATLLRDGRVLLAGGMVDENSSSSQVEIYDPAQKRFISVAAMREARYGHTATLLPSGKVLICGGSNGKDDLGSAEIYDPSGNTFTLVPGGMSAVRTGHQATLLSNGKVLVAGGADKTDIYDPQSNTFKQGADVTTRYFLTATLLRDSRVLLTGGRVDKKAFNSIEYYGEAVQPEPDDGKSPVIRTHPLSQTVTAGKKAEFTVSAQGKNLCYKWFRNGSSIPNATEDTFVMPAVSMEDSGAGFSVEVSNAVGSVISNTAFLTVEPASTLPSVTRFTATPSTIKAGEEVRLLGEYTNGEGVVTPGYIPLASGVPMTLKPRETTTYTLTVTNSAGQTATAVLTVIVGTSTNPAPGVFSPSGSLKVERVGHTSTLLPNGKVLVAGGSRTHDAGTVLASAELYDPALGTFTPAGNLADARRGHTATLLANGMVLMTGGASNAIKPLDSAELYDPAKNSFTRTGAMLAGRNAHTASLLPDGSVLLVGGAEGAEIYIPKTGKFQIAASPVCVRRNHTATAFSSGRILIAGGRDLNGKDLDSAEIYDPAIKGFTKVGGNMTSARRGHCAVLLNNGLVLLAGGTGPTEALSSAEIYDPVINGFRATAAMACVRAEAAATLLQNGLVLVSGYGIYTELFNPETALFTFAGNLGNARSLHTSTLLHDGSVLIVGGAGDKAILAATERYTPFK